ncbi:FkbM family methyltransferase [Brevundimonas sp.]|jgi:FkbM family methyltransferase|uniref:FkbM family methyltransferase n=1 Tax=Brevundimonas sp. TaxID=1871086 RepID=UPI002E113F49
MAALGRVVRWQIAVRLLPAAHFILPFANGSSLAVCRGMEGATGNWYGGLDEPDEMGFLLHLLRAGDRFLDIGANVGSYTVLAASVPGVTGVAFEPVPATHHRLRRNLIVNDATDRFEARQCGVGDAAGVLRFTTTLDSMNFVAPDDYPDDDTVEVRVVRLDDAMPDRDGPIVAKIDVEGFEKAVLTGGARTLGSEDVLAVVMETNGSGERYGVTDAELFDLMAALGFTPHHYDALSRTLSPARPGDPAHINTLFLKDVATVTRRTREAPPAKLVNGSL